MLKILPILFAILIHGATSVPLNETVLDFEESMGLFSQFCQPGIATLQRLRYEDNFFPKPNNISEFFLTGTRPGCSQTPIFETSDEVELVVRLFRFSQPNGYLDVNFVNTRGDILSETNIPILTTVNWTDISIKYPPTESFRIRLIYRSETEGVFLAVDTITINLHYYVPPIQNFTGCISDDFSDDSLGLRFYPCHQSGFADFQRLKYSDMPSIYKPLGSNDFFMSTANNTMPSCMNYPFEISLNNQTEVIISIYTDNEDGVTDWASLMAFDSMNSTVEIMVVQVDNSRRWKRVSMKMREDVDVKLRLFTQNFSNNKAFIAIDSAGIKDADSEDCTTNCQCSLYRSKRSIDQDIYASIEDQDTTSFGLMSVIVSTTVVVSILWGIVVTAFVFRKSLYTKMQGN